MNKGPITPSRLRELLHYEASIGAFTWIKPTTRSIKVGDVAGSAGRYVGITVDGHRYYAHRLAWMYVHGHFPKTPLDHINGDGRDNRIENLRSCTDAQNQQNRVANRTNVSGYVGVAWSRREKCWRAQIGLGGKSHHLGYFSDAEQAHRAYLEAKTQMHAFQPVPRDREAA